MAPAAPISTRTGTIRGALAHSHIGDPSHPAVLDSGVGTDEG